MSRSALTYGDRAAHKAFAGVDVTKPKAGFYRYRLRSGSVRGGVKIWHGPPSDPVTGEELDRSWRWQAEMDGVPIDLDEVWPMCAREEISEQQYREFVARREWAVKNAPNSAYADSRRRHDLLSLSSPLLF